MSSNHIVPVQSRDSQLASLIAAARAKLAAIDATFTREKAGVDALRARLFRVLRALFERVDEAGLYLKSREQILDGLRKNISNAEVHVQADFEEARSSSRRRYEQTAKELESKQELSAEEDVELNQLWKKLVRLYHPDRYANDAEKMRAYTQLTAAINGAKDAGDIKTLRDIANDPSGFMSRKGWDTLDFADNLNLEQLEKLYSALLREIDAAQKQLDQLRSSSDFALLQSLAYRTEGFDEAVSLQRVALEKQLKELEAKTTQAEKDIAGAKTLWHRISGLFSPKAT